MRGDSTNGHKGGRARARARVGEAAGAFCKTLRLHACLAETTGYGIFTGTSRRPTPSFSLPNEDVYEESYADVGARFTTGGR